MRAYLAASSWDRYPFRTLSRDSQRDSNPYEARTRFSLSLSCPRHSNLGRVEPRDAERRKARLVERRPPRISARGPTSFDGDPLSSFECFAEDRCGNSTVLRITASVPSSFYFPIRTSDTRRIPRIPARDALSLFRSPRRPRVLQTFVR